MVVINSKVARSWNNPKFSLKLGEHTYANVPKEHARAVMDLCSSHLATLHGVSAPTVRDVLKTVPELADAIQKVKNDEKKAAEDTELAKMEREEQLAREKSVRERAAESVQKKADEKKAAAEKPADKPKPEIKPTK